MHHARIQQLDARLHKLEALSKAWTDAAREASALARQHRTEANQHAAVASQKGQQKDWAFRDMHSKLSNLHNELADRYATQAHQIVHADQDPASMTSSGVSGHPMYWSAVDTQQKPTPRIHTR